MAQLSCCCRRGTMPFWARAKACFKHTKLYLKENIPSRIRALEVNNIILWLSRHTYNIYMWFTKPWYNGMSFFLDLFLPGTSSYPREQEEWRRKNIRKKLERNFENVHGWWAVVSGYEFLRFRLHLWQASSEVAASTVVSEVMKVDFFMRIYSAWDVPAAMSQAL